MNTTYFLNLAARKLFKDSTAPIYVGLSTTAPNIDGSGATEPVADGNGYARALISGLSEPAAGIITNEGDIRLSRILKDSGTATHYVIYDAEAVGTGNLLGYGPLDPVRRLEPNTAVVFEAGKLKLQAANPVEAGNG